MELLVSDSTIVCNRVKELGLAWYPQNRKCFTLYFSLKTSLAIAASSDKHLQIDPVNMSSVLMELFAQIVTYL